MRTHGPPWGCRLVGHQFADDVRCGLGLRCGLRCLCGFLATTAGFFGLLAESVCEIARDGADRADRKFKPPARAQAIRVTGQESTPGPEADCPRAVIAAAGMPRWTQSRPLNPWPGTRPHSMSAQPKPRPCLPARTGPKPAALATSASAPPLRVQRSLDCPGGPRPERTLGRGRLRSDSLQLRQNLRNDLRFLDAGDDPKPSAAARAGHDVVPEQPLQPPCPAHRHVTRRLRRPRAMRTRPRGPRRSDPVPAPAVAMEPSAA